MAATQRLQYEEGKRTTVQPGNEIKMDPLTYVSWNAFPDGENANNKMWSQNEMQLEHVAMNTWRCVFTQELNIDWENSIPSEVT